MGKEKHVFLMHGDRPINPPTLFRPD